MSQKFGGEVEGEREKEKGAIRMIILWMVVLDPVVCLYHHLHRSHPQVPSQDQKK